jgi:hypothetical protein
VAAAPAAATTVAASAPTDAAVAGSTDSVDGYDSLFDTDVEEDAVKTQDHANISAILAASEEKQPAKKKLHKRNTPTAAAKAAVPPLTRKHKATLPTPVARKSLRPKKL